MAFFNGFSSLPYVSGPQNPYTIFVEQVCERVHVVTVPSLLPFVDDGCKLISVSLVAIGDVLTHAFDAKEKSMTVTNTTSRVR